jgi:hypothetical protein
MPTERIGAAAIALIALLVATARAAAQDRPEDQPRSRATGLPEAIEWSFDFDAGWASFGFANSLFDNPKAPGVDEDLSDQWFEGYVKPALSAAYSLKSSSEWYGNVSVVGQRTYGSVPAMFGQDVSSFGPDDLLVGWRSGDALGWAANALDISVGRSQYRVGHGFLLSDGATDGGGRGGYWTNARKAFEFAAIGRVKAAGHLVEGFFLDHDDLDEHETGSRLSGANYELSVGEHNTVGVTYMRWLADAAVEPGRDGLDVFNMRGYIAPIAPVPDLSFELEYASERNADALRSDAWTAQAAYQLSGVAWTPKVSYRYAFFRGDDPDTPRNEAFDPLFPGFHDWGTWWQGEIAGEYFLSNSNLKSNLIRVHVDPNEALGLGLLFFTFNADEPRSIGTAVTATDVALEADVYADWKLNSQFTLSLVGAFANPGTAVEQASGRTKNFGYGMAYVAYSF